MADLAVDGSTLALYHCDGAIASAEKIDNAEGTSGRDLTENNTPLASTGFDGETDGAYNFDGTSEYCVSSAAVFAGTETAATVEGWFYFDDDAAAEEFFIDTTGGGVGVVMIRNGSSVKGRVRFSVAGGDQDTGTATVASGGWHYLALTIPGLIGTVRLYVDGAEAATRVLAAAAGTLGTGALGLGAARTGSVPANCQVDEVRVSNVERTSTEISDHWDANQAATGVVIIPTLLTLGVG